MVLRTYVKHMPDIYCTLSVRYYYRLKISINLTYSINIYCAYIANPD